MDKSTKKAIAYSLLAHIRNSGVLTKGPLELFVPIVKKGMHHINSNGLYKGESIAEIKDVLEQLFGIDFPIPVLNNILKIIAKEVNTAEETVFTLNNDYSFWIKDFIFDDYDLKLKEYQNEIGKLQKLFGDFCKANSVDNTENNCIIKFIEKNKVSISKYIANSSSENGKSFLIEARFVEYFRQNNYIFSQIKNIYLGSILTCYLEYEPSEVKMNVTLLFDTNFLVSLLDLNTPESTHTCKKLLEICKKIGYDFKVLNETIEETRNLLNSKANNIDSAVIIRHINKEDIYNACERRKLTRTDLDRITDNLETTFVDFGINIIPHTESLFKKAKFSNEYTLLKQYRNSDRAALHDAAAIIYVKDKRGKRIKEFENVNCWFVNNSITHENDSENFNPILNPSQTEYQPEIIKVDDLLNVIWLSNPSINTSLPNDELIDIGLTSLVASTLNEALPKVRIIKELDINIQKYRNESISDKDVLLLSTRIANGQVKNIEKLSELAKNDSKKFNESIKEEARKQETIENERNARFEDLLSKLEDKYNELGDYKKTFDKRKSKEIESIKEKSQTELSRKDDEIKKLKEENIRLENKRRKVLREEYIKNALKSWRNESWLYFTIFITLLIISLIWLCITLSNNQATLTNSFINNLFQSKIFSAIFSFIVIILNYFVIRSLYDKYNNHSNINSYKASITIPEELQDIRIE